MNKKVEQEFAEIKAELEATEKATIYLVERGEQLKTRLTRLNMLRQIQNLGVARNTPSWVVNGRSQLEISSSIN